MSPHYYWLPDDLILVQFARPFHQQALPFSFEGRNLIKFASVAFVNMSPNPSTILLKCVKNRYITTDMPFVRMLQANLPSLQVFNTAAEVPDELKLLQPVEKISYAPHLAITDEQDIIIFKLLMSEYYRDSA